LPVRTSGLISAPYISPTHFPCEMNPRSQFLVKCLSPRSQKLFSHFFYISRRRFLIRGHSLYLPRFGSFEHHQPLNRGRSYIGNLVYEPSTSLIHSPDGKVFFLPRPPSESPMIFFGFVSAERWRIISFPELRKPPDLQGRTDVLALQTRRGSWQWKAKSESP